MTPEQWARVKEVFTEALTREPAMRSSFVADATAGDETVRAEVERLLAADTGTGDFIERPAAETFLAGRAMGRYEVTRLVGSGGMGRVYAARDTELGREVAIKVAAAWSPDAQARLRREAQHASRLNHPHICHIYEVGRADGQLFVVMELIEGRSLADRLRDGPLPIETARRYASEIADALAHAHERGVMHRDLKSTNVMITARGARVLDFGLARALETHEIDQLSQSQRSLTADGTIAGTLPYMAPELLRGERGDQRADIWALGVLLYEMVGGRRPFTGATGFELSAAILHEPPPPLPESVPGRLAAIIERCLAKAPDDRPPRAADVHQALESMLAPPPLPFALPVSRQLAALKVPAMSRTRLVLLLLLVAWAAAAVIQQFRTDDPEPPSFSKSSGYSLLYLGQFDAAREQLRGVVDEDPDDADAWDSLGEGYLASGLAEDAFESYSRALTISPRYTPSLLGRGLSLAALGRYDEALTMDSPDLRIQAFLLSRVGRYRQAADILEAGRRELADEPESLAGALLMSSMLSMERGNHVRARAELAAAETTLVQVANEPKHSMLVFADLLGGTIAIRAGQEDEAAKRRDAQLARYDRTEPVEARWTAALEGELSLARGEFNRALASFEAAERPAWVALGGDIPAAFVMNPPSHDGLARVALARDDRAAAIEEYRRLTAVGGRKSPAPLLEPRDVLALARLLAEEGDTAGARAEYERFLSLWSRADEDLPEVEEARRALGK